MIRKIVTPKGNVVGTIGVSGRLVSIVWSTGEMMVFRGNATLIFRQGRNELHIPVVDGKIQTVCKLVPVTECPTVTTCDLEDISIGNIHWFATKS